MSTCLRGGDASVSVVIPCYNAAPFLRDTIVSVLTQSYPVAEVIVIDDGSTDGSAAIAHSIGGDVRVISQKNRGESAARNRGAKVAHGSHLLFLDSDDLLRSEAIERQLRVLGGRSDAVAVMGHERFERLAGDLGDVRPLDAADFLPNVIWGTFGPMHVMLIPRKAFDRTPGFDEAIRHGEDWLFACQLGLNGVQLVRNEYIGALYRVHTKSQSVRTRGCRSRSLELVTILGQVGAGILSDEGLRRRWAELLFWRLLAGLRDARRAGIGWTEVAALVAQIETIALDQTSGVFLTRYARAVRAVGVRPVESVAYKVRKFPGWFERLIS